MTLTALDWAIVFGYFALTIGIGLYFSKRGSASLTDYFLSGRSVPWWLAGGSMVATTFAADTPLAVTGFVDRHGIAGNWVWWNAVMSGMLTVFFFARLWRRSGVMTDVELAEIRYSGRPAAVLRGFRAIYLAIPINLIILGWVNAAMIKVLQISLGVNVWVALGICFLITVFYSVAAGLWAVLWTDLVQFAIMITAATALAILAVREVGGMEALEARIIAERGAGALSVMPVAVEGGSIVTYAWLPILLLSVWLAVQWWASWYPGAEPGGGGYVAQRIFAARSERDGVLATLFFQIAHYAIRPWPWIITALAAMVLYPAAQYADREAIYVRAFIDLMPTPLRGLMLAGFAAAYMSTVSTHLNWGASYLVNDVYRRFVKRNESERHYVFVSRLSVVGLFLLSGIVAWRQPNVGDAWLLLLALGAGTGSVLILRWYWWRINAWSEISAMLASLVASLTATAMVPRYFAEGDPNSTAVIMLITVLVSTVTWLTVTMLTRPEPRPVLHSFYKRVRPGGRGWLPVSGELGLGRERIAGGGHPWINWLAGVVAVYSTLFGIGQLIFGEVMTSMMLFGLAALAFVWIGRSLRRSAEPPAFVAGGGT